MMNVRFLVLLRRLEGSAGQRSHDQGAGQAQIVHLGGGPTAGEGTNEVKV